MADQKRDLTPEEQEEEKLKYRFGGTKYQWQGPAHSADNQVVYELPGLFAYPKSEEKPE